MASPPHPTGGPAPDPAGAGPRERQSGPARRQGPAASAENDGPVLPDVTTDESGHGWGERLDDDDDERFLRELPPHHLG